MTADDAEALAARIQARLTAALTVAERGGFTTTWPALAGEDGEPRVTLEQIARIAAYEAAKMSDMGAP